MVHMDVHTVLHQWQNVTTAEASPTPNVQFDPVSYK